MQKYGIVLIKPAVEGLQAVHQPCRIVSEISLPVAELKVIDACPQSLLIQTFAYQAGQLCLNGPHEGFLLSLIGILRDDGKDGLLHAIVIGTHDIMADSRVQKGLLKRRPRHGQKHILQHLHAQIQLLIQGISHGLIPGKVGIVLLALLLRDGILLHDFPHLRKGRLRADLGVDLQPVKMGQIIFIQPGQLLRHIAVSIEENVAVGRMVIAPVEIQECLPGKLRDLFRIPAGLIRIGGIRVKGGQHLPLQHALRRGEGALHLIVNHAVQGQLPVLRLHLVVPALLAEDLFFLINIRIKHRVHIDMDQVLKILVIAAGHRIHGLIRIRHGVQECI